MRRPNFRSSATRAAGWLRRLAEGIPTFFVALLAAVVLVAILYTIAAREPKEARGYAEVAISRTGCTLEGERQLNATACVRVSPGVYRVTFNKSLSGSTVIASRASCCPGPIGASADTDTSVLLVVGRRVRAPIRASVLVP